MNLSPHEWKQLLQDSDRATEIIRSSVERNRLKKFLKAMQINCEKADGSLIVTPKLSETFNQIQWGSRLEKISSRLIDARKNLPKNGDRKLIVSILEHLEKEAAKQLPKKYQDQQLNMGSIATPSTDHKTRDLYLKKELPKVKKHLNGFSPKLFISYASSKSEIAFVKKLAEHLALAGMEVRLDLWHNGLSTAILTEFIDEIEAVDYILVIGSPLYGAKHREKKNNTVFIEIRLIAERCKSQPSRILPILQSGSPKESIPGFLRDKVYADFTKEKAYIQELNKVILALCKYADDVPGLKNILSDIEDSSPEK